MIRTIADLLNEFVLAEKEILNQKKIKHPTTIGTMYEGLTARVLNRYLFKGLNLRVVKNSFINGCNTEFDVMLVEGEGEKITYTDRYIYKPEQIIVVIQVKKNLYSKDIKEGFNNLRFLINYFEPRNKDINEFDFRLFRDAFKTICRKDVTAKFSKYEESIYTALRVDAFLPVRIIWGYNGFASEFSFRESFFEYLKTNLTTDLNKPIKGFGPHNFPNLIICGQYSLIKQNGMPFNVPIEEGKWWNLYTTSSYTPTNFLLEVIWTRLSYKFIQLPINIFGEDLIMEPFNRFIDCRIIECNDNYLWEYDYFRMSNEALKDNSKVTEWQPVELDRIQYKIVNEICEKGEVDLSDNSFKHFVTNVGSYSSPSDFVDKLRATGLIFVEFNKLKLLTNQCQCAILPNGKFVAGENASGRFTNWIMRENSKSNKQK